MKSRLFAFVLMLTVSCWAQTSTQSAPAQSKAPETKPKCACCDKMSDAKDAAACCHHMDQKDGKMAECCSGKDGASCCKDMQCGKADAKDKTAQSSTAKDCCGAGKACCGEGKECCHASKDGDKSAMACCGGQQCGMHKHAEEHPGMPQ